MRHRMARRLVPLGVVILALAVATIALAGSWDNDPDTGDFKPQFFVRTGSQANAPMSLHLEVTQQPTETIADGYRVEIPAGWRFSVGSVRPADPTKITSCKDIDSSNTGQTTSAIEALGKVYVTVQTTDTESTALDLSNPTPPPPGPVTYKGIAQPPGKGDTSEGLFFLRWVPDSSSSTTGTAILCAVVTTFNTRIKNVDSRTIAFEIDMHLNNDGSWTMTWNLRAVPGDAPGHHSVVDNTYFQSVDVSVLDIALNFESYTIGNWNTDPATGEKTGVLFVKSPVYPGAYPFIATIAPCSNPALACRSNASDVTKVVTINLAGVPQGLHSIPTVTSPAPLAPIAFADNSEQFAIVMGRPTIDLKWTPPSLPPTEHVRGYLVSIGLRYDSSKIIFRRLITDPSAVDYDASADPCSPQGAAPECALVLSFPMTTPGGTVFGTEGLYAMSIVTLFTDGHRSDGKCDDGTGPGRLPPCADNTTPGFSPPGWAAMEVFLTQRVWPLKYIQSFAKGGTGFSVVSQIWLAFVDFDKNEAQIVQWFPVGKRYSMKASTIVGSNQPPFGTLDFLNNGDPSGQQRFSFFGWVTPVNTVTKQFTGFLTPWGASTSPGTTTGISAEPITSINE